MATRARLANDFVCPNCAELMKAEPRLVREIEAEGYECAGCHERALKTDHQIIFYPARRERPRDHGRR